MNDDSGRMIIDGPALQNIPLRTEEGRAIQSIMLGRDPERESVDIDYASLEIRLAAAMSDFFEARHPKTANSKPPKNSTPIDVMEFVNTGMTSFVVEPGYIGVAQSRREVVVASINKVGQKLIALLFAYRNETAKTEAIDSRKRRRAIEKCRRKIIELLPKGVTLREALQALS